MHVEKIFRDLVICVVKVLLATMGVNVNARAMVLEVAGRVAN